jgi:hypothetical protein
LDYSIPSSRKPANNLSKPDASSAGKACAPASARANA